MADIGEMVITRDYPSATRNVISPLNVLVDNSRVEGLAIVLFFA